MPDPEPMTAPAPGAGARPRRVVVGFSGSGASRRALRWAVLECAATARPLRVVLVREGSTAAPAHLEQALSQELERVPGREPAVDVTVTTGQPASALLVEAADGALLVLGRGRGGAPGGGRVLAACLQHAPVPVVLVGPQAVLGPPRRLLVVSAPGSADDPAPVAWAARGDRLPLRVLTTWQAPPAGAERRHAHLLAAQRHHAVLAQLGAAGGGAVRAVVVEGATGDVLARRTVVGDLVVVAATAVRALPVHLLRVPLVLVPPSSRTIVLPDATAATTAGRRRAAGLARA
ncbi:universal stress protein [Kineococcus sp. SYSU DK006]|uniref:universal stress protein n=1 Tax=Kineococcus sp. SYSU DK006 TaxID=3383127 RepID=UPI003D7CD99D